jgi:urate oxidase
MSISLAGNNYGKSRVRVMKVTRRPERHDLVELSVNVQFEGDFDAVHLAGDNRAVLPTDTMKNTVNALAKTWSGEQIEDFGRQLVEHFLDGNPQVSRVRIEIAQSEWERMDRYAFAQGSGERRTTEVAGTRGGLDVASGLENMVILKTTGSGFEGYKKDRYTTLKETSDRILATAVRADWKYRSPEVEYGACWQRARAAMLKTFIEQDSPSVQQTAYAMGAAALEAVPEIEGIRLSLPNKHCLLIDLAPFGIENRNEIFVPTDEPHGLIEVSVGRGQALPE